MSRMNLIVPVPFTSDSPHSTYICQDYANEGVQCGYRQ